MLETLVRSGLEGKTGSIKTSLDGDYSVPTWQLQYFVEIADVLPQNTIACYVAKLGDVKRLLGLVEG